MYEYLKKYIPGGNEINDNWFVPLYKRDILEAEKYLGFSFPSLLKDFYLNIGYGCLRSPHDPPKDYKFYGKNEILPPLVAAHFYKGIIEHHTIEEKQEALNYDEDYWFSHETLEYTTPGDLPFFEIGDSSSFLMMKPQSEFPNTVYDIGGDIVEKEFKDFIWKLYYKDPSYYSENW